MKKQLKTMILTSCLTLLVTMPSFAGWQQTENGQWKYEQNGTVLTGQWYQDQDGWYYLDADGIMLADTTRNIDGVDYSFGADGKWIEHQTAAVTVREGWNLYECKEAGYSIQYPSTMRTSTSGDTGFDLKSDYAYVGVAHVEVPRYADPNSAIENLRNFYANNSYLTYINASEVQINGATFTKYYYTHSDGITKLDLYVRYDSSTSILYGMAAGYVGHSQASTMEIVNTFHFTP